MVDILVWGAGFVSKKPAANGHVSWPVVQAHAVEDLAQALVVFVQHRQQTTQKVTPQKMKT